MKKLNLFLVTLFVFKLTYAQGPGIGGGGGIGDGSTTGVVVIDQDLYGDIVIDWSGSESGFEGAKPVTILPENIDSTEDSSLIGSAAVNMSDSNIGLANEMISTFKKNPTQVFTIDPETYSAASKEEIEKTVVMLGLKNAYLKSLNRVGVKPVEVINPGVVEDMISEPLVEIK